MECFSGKGHSSFMCGSLPRNEAVDKATPESSMNYPHFLKDKMISHSFAVTG